MVSPGHFTSEAKSARSGLDRRLGGPQSRSMLCEEEENVLALSGMESSSLVVQHSLVTILTELNRLAACPNEEAAMLKRRRLER
jgi:hypothetical protein